MQKILEKITFALLISIWLSHLVQVFTPEVGFDAVWYHLPVIKTILEQKKMVFLPNLYQSANPLGSDLIFGIGFSWGGELGAKVVAYLFGLLLMAACYLLSKKFLNRFWSLVVVLIISTFQVVAWQSASFYVDVAKAFWEISALWALLNWQKFESTRWLVLSALLLGASLATKLFSLFLLPMMLVLVWLWSKDHHLKKLIIFLSSALILPLPFYVFAYLKTGNPFFSFIAHLDKLSEIGGNGSLVFYFWERTQQLISFPNQLLVGKDYTSIILLLFFPILIWLYREIRENKFILGISLFVVTQMALWWYLPPLSTRYTLSGFIVWTIVSIWGAAKLIKTNKRFYQPILVTILLAVLINVIPRVYVNYRSFQYILGIQTKEEYIHQFLDGNIDQHLIKWHQLD
jgi:4-amino-4-deoxy-L-arabinose transferase-like glycosyltransferase